MPGSICIKATAQLAGGRQVSFDTTDPTGGLFRAGQRVSLAVAEQPGQPPTYYIQDLERGRPMLVLAALFVGAVVAFGRWQGIRSLVGLGCRLWSSSASSSRPSSTATAVAETTVSATAVLPPIGRQKRRLE